MLAGQTLVARDGYEVALFPMPYLYMTQDEGADYSHAGTYNIDLIGWSLGGRVYQAPIYAPCTCKLVWKEDSYAAGNIRIFQSTREVHTPSGLQYICFYFGHDSAPPINTIGAVANQGDLIYHTGTYGQATGDHTHTCMGYGQWVSHSYNITTRPPNNHQDFTYRLHYWDAVYVNDTVVYRGFNHDWVTWDEPIPHVTFDNGNFPWVLYANKLRNKRS